MRIKLQAEAGPTDPLRSDQRRSTAEECVEDDVTARRAVENGIGHKFDRLNRRMQREQVALLAIAPERVRPRIGPNVGSVAAVAAQLDVVPMRSPALFVHQNQLVLAAVERTHAGAALV